MNKLISIFNNGSLGEDESTKPEKESQQTGSPKTRKDGKYLTFTIDELREFGCYAASTGRGLDSYKTRLVAIAESRRDAIEQECEEKSAEPKDRLERIKAERDALLASVDPEAKHTTEAALKCELAVQKTHISGLMVEAKSDKPILISQERRRLAKEQSDAEEASLKDRIALAEKRREIIEQHRTANLDELNRQAGRIQEHSKELPARLEVARAQAAELNLSGITHHVTSFLIWGSSVSLVGAGVAVTQLMQRASQRLKPNKRTRCLSPGCVMFTLQPTC